VQVPVNVPVGGKLLLSTNADLLLRGGAANLTVGGELEIQSGARLRLENASPAMDLTLLPGSTLSGTGTIQVDGSNRVVAPGDFDSSIFLQLNNTARLVAPGTYYVRTSRTMSGTLQVGAVVVASNATFSVSSTTIPVPMSVEAGGRLRLTGGLVSFGSNVLVAAEGRLDVEASTTVSLSGGLTNLGVMRWISGNNAFTLQGSGRVENAGLWEVHQDPGCPTCNTESWVQVPVNVPVGGKLLLSTNADLLLRGGAANLTVGGELEIQSGARLRLENASPAMDLTLLAGANLRGMGTVLVQGANRVVLAGDVLCAVGLLDMTGSSSITGPHRLTIGANGSLRFDHNSTIFGSLAVQGGLIVASAGVTLTINGTLTLESGSLLNNPGTVRVGALVNLGGTIIGKTPEVLGGRFSIQAITLAIVSEAVPSQPAGAAPRASAATIVTLECRVPAGRQFIVEASTDLQRWDGIDADIAEITPGVFRATLRVHDVPHCFYRLRQRD
jgi:hypothetical protein